MWSTSAATSSCQIASRAGPGVSGVAQKRTRWQLACAARTNCRSRARSASGIGPMPCQVNRVFQLSLISGMNDAGAPELRSALRPS
jgi:hypothetical protein